MNKSLKELEDILKYNFKDKSLLNKALTHKSYNKFREKRGSLRDKNKKINGLELTKTLESYAETGSEYTKI